MAIKWGLLSGALAGVTAGLLLAPKSGNVTRRWVRIKSTRYVKEAREKLTNKEEVS